MRARGTLSTRGSPLEEGAFEGVRVVELAQWVFVPVAGALLADWGADVIRIERPEGDPYRGLATQGIGTDSGGVNMSIALGEPRQAVNRPRPPEGGGSNRPASAPRDGRRVPHELPTRSTASSGARRGDADGAVPEARVRTWPRVRRARPRCRQPRVRRVRLLGPRRDGACAHPAGPRPTHRPAGRDG